MDSWIVASTRIPLGQRKPGSTSVTLRRGERAEDTLLRGQIDEIQATAKSLMPEGLEVHVSKQDIADLIAYLQAVAVPR